MYDSKKQSTQRQHIFATLSIRGGSDDGGSNIQPISSLSQVQTIINDAASTNQLVVLDFASDNCPPCEMIAPIYDELSQLEEFEDVIFCKVNVTYNPGVAEAFDVDGWPTFVLFKNGEVVDSIVGGAGCQGWVVRYGNEE